MKIVVVTDRPEATTVGRRRATRIVNQLSDRHQVTLLSVWAGDAPSLASAADQTALLAETSTGTEPIRDHSLTADQLRLLAAAPTTESESEDELTRLAELELNHALSISDADVVVVSDARLIPVVSEAAPAAAVVVALHPGLPDPEVLGHLAHADVVVTSRGGTAAVLEDFFGPSAPWVVTEPFPGSASTTPTASAEGQAPGESIIAVCGTADSEFIEQVEWAFLEATESLPSARLHVCIDDEPLRPLKRPISQSGRHGAVTFGPHDSWQSLGEAGLSALVVGPSDDDESAEVATEALSRGVRVVAVGSCAAADLVSSPDLRAVPEDRTSIHDVLSHLVGLESESLAPAPAPAGPATTPGDRDAFWDDLLEQLAEGKSPTASRGERRLGVEAAMAFPIEQLLVPTPDLREAEERLEADHPSLARWRGRLSEVHDTQLEIETWNRNLHDVVSVLEHADIAHILVSDRFEPGRVAVSEHDRAAVASALARRLHDAPFYVDLLDDLGEPTGTVLASQIEDAAPAPSILVYRSVITTSRTLLYGPEQGCAIEFWSQDEETKAFMSPPASPSRRGFALESLAQDATLTVADRDIATRREMLEPTNDDIDFPIDVVWTWLDDADDEWRGRRDDHLLAAGARLSDPHVAARFVNRDELKYSMRSVAMYAPWVRHLYVVTDRQTPEWLDTSHHQVSVIDHREIFKDPAALPTFNSHAIESQLHHIPGLSEHFVYFNDDFFLGRMLHPSMFFTPVGQAVAFQSGVFVPPGPQTELDRLFFAYRKNDRDLFARTFGRTLVHSYLHAPYALRVSVMEELEKKFPEEWQETMHSRFRSLSDHAFATCFVQAWGVEAGKIVHGEVMSRYVKAGTREHQPLMREILARRHLETFCLNDTGENDLPAEEHETAMAAFMEAYFPVRAPWEKS